MSEWLLTKAFFLFNAIGAFCWFFLFVSSLSALWGAVRKEYFAYRETMPESTSGHLMVWLVSILSTAASLQSFDHVETNWSLHHFDFEDFVAGMDFSLIVHSVMAAVIFIRLWFNHEKK